VRWAAVYCGDSTSSPSGGDAGLPFSIQSRKVDGPYGALIGVKPAAVALKLKKSLSEYGQSD